MSWKTLDAMALEGKRVLTRVDINVPVRDGQVTDDTRIRRVLPTIRDICNAGGKVILLAHFGRPKGKITPEMSLDQVRPALEEALGQPVGFATFEAATEAISNLSDGGVLLLENTRFFPGEEANDPDFVDQLASFGDVFCNDAFSAAHRAHASTTGLATRLPSCAGRLMQAELEALEQALSAPKRPLVAVVGGAKVSTKIELLGNLIAKTDQIIIGGGMANTFLAALGHNVGASLCEHDLVDLAQDIMGKAEKSGCELILPEDLVCATAFEANARHAIRTRDTVRADEMILDAGPLAVARIQEVIGAAKTLVWNGPLGAFELPPFNAATDAAARFAAEQTAQGALISVAGGGDTVAALNHSGSAANFSYISTAGGAFLEWLEGKTLPGVAALEAT